MQLTHDPSLSSYYVNEGLYQELVESFSDWQRDELAIADPSERDRFRMLIEREARLLDQLRFDEWLSMHLLGPGHPRSRRSAPGDYDLLRRPSADGRPHLSPAHGLCLVASSQIAHRPDDLQRRSILYAAELDSDGALKLSDQRVPRFLSGWCGHRFIENAHSWQIRARQVNLIDCDQNLRNPSIVL